MGGNLRSHRTDLISLPPSYFYPFAIDWNTEKMWKRYAQLSPCHQHGRTLLYPGLQLQPLLWKEQSLLTCSRLAYKEKLVRVRCTHLRHSTFRHIPVFSYSRHYEECHHFDRYLGCKLAFAAENKGIFYQRKRPCLPPRSCLCTASTALMWAGLTPACPATDEAAYSAAGRRSGPPSRRLLPQKEFASIIKSRTKFFLFLIFV